MKHFFKFHGRVSFRKKIFLYVLFITIIPSTGFILERSITLRKEIYQEKEISLQYQTDIVESQLKIFYNYYLSDKYDNITAAQEEALFFISQYRYGENGLNYFWIQGQYPNNTAYMLMHPYFPDLATGGGTEVDDLAKEIMNIALLEVQKDDDTPNEGFIEYDWPSSYNETQTYTKKLSYIRLFEEWDWIIGTGIYIDDITQIIQLNLISNLLYMILLFGVLGSVLVYLIVRELQEKQKIQQSLEQSEFKFNELIKNMDEGYIIIDSSLNIKFLNHQFAYMLGYAENEVINHQIEEFLAPSQFQIVQEQISSDKKDKNESYELQFLAKSKISIDTIISPSRIFSATGQHIFSGAVITNISEIKKIQLSLSQQKEQLKLILNNLGEGVILTDNSGMVQFLNSVAESMTNTRRSNVIGKSIDEILKLSDNGNRVSINTEYLQNQFQKQGRSRIYTTSLQLDSLETYLISLSIIPLQNKENNYYGYIIVFRDITTYQQIESNMMKSHQIESLGILAGGIGHDFNNFLTSILGSLSLIENQMPDKNEDLLELVKEAKLASIRAEQLAKQLLTFSQGGMLEKHMTNIAELVKKTTNFALRGSNVKSRFKFGSELPNITIDETQIAQVLHNLTINAMQAMPLGGNLDIAVNVKEIFKNEERPILPGMYLEIIVRDYGIGITQKNIPSIFKPYYTTKDEGHGLGLAMSYKIVKNHGGYIYAASELNKGTTITVLLPIIIQTPQDKSEMILTEHKGSGIVQILDDDESVHFILRKILEMFGYQVQVFFTGEELIKKYRELYPNEIQDIICILDLTIPGGKGAKEVLKELKKINPQVIAIICTGYIKENIIPEFQNLGFKGFLQKPFTLETVATLFEKILNSNK